MVRDITLSEVRVDRKGVTDMHKVRDRPRHVPGTLEGLGMV